MDARGQRNIRAPKRYRAGGPDTDSDVEYTDSREVIVKRKKRGTTTLPVRAYALTEVPFDALLAAPETFDAVGTQLMSADVPQSIERHPSEHKPHTTKGVATDLLEQRRLGNDRRLAADEAHLRRERELQREEDDYADDPVAALQLLEERVELGELRSIRPPKVVHPAKRISITFQARPTPQVSRSSSSEQSAGVDHRAMSKFGPVASVSRSATPLTPGADMHPTPVPKKRGRPPKAVEDLARPRKKPLKSATPSDSPKTPKQQTKPHPIAESNTQDDHRSTLTSSTSSALEAIAASFPRLDTGLPAMPSLMQVQSHLTSQGHPEDTISQARGPDVPANFVAHQDRPCEYGHNNGNMQSTFPTPQSYPQPYPQYHQSTPYTPYTGHPAPVHPPYRPLVPFTPMPFPSEYMPRRDPTPLPSVRQQNSSMPREKSPQAFSPTGQECFRQRCMGEAMGSQGTMQQANSVIGQLNPHDPALAYPQSPLQHMNPATSRGQHGPRLACPQSPIQYSGPAAETGQFSHQQPLPARSQLSLQYTAPVPATGQGCHLNAAPPHHLPPMYYTGPASIRSLPRPVDAVRQRQQSPHVSAARECIPTSQMSNEAAGQVPSTTSQANIGSQTQSTPIDKNESTARPSVRASQPAPTECIPTPSSSTDPLTRRRRPVTTRPQPGGLSSTAISHPSDAVTQSFDVQPRKHVSAPVSRSRAMVWHSDTPPPSRRHPNYQRIMEEAQKSNKGGQ